MLKEILQSIYLNIADYSEELNDSSSITNVSIAANIATVTLADDVSSDLGTGNFIIINGIKAKNEIVSLTPISNGWLVETSVNHDLTFEAGDEDVTVVFTGFNEAQWNHTEFTVTEVVSQTEFKISNSLSAPTGTGFLLEDRFGTIRGLQILTGVSNNVITFDTDTPFTDYYLTDAKVNYNYRITAVYDEEKAFNHYNQRNEFKKPWGYLILGDAPASKDNNIDSDSIIESRNLDAINVTLINNFSILVIKDSSDYNTSLVTQEALLDLRYGLLKSLFGLKLEFTNYKNSSFYLVSYIGDAPFSYIGAAYSHVYNFQVQQVLTVFETVENKDISAFRDLAIDVLLPFDSYTNTKKDIDIKLPS